MTYPSSNLKLAWVLLVLMVATAITAYSMTPRKYLADQRVKVELNQLVPETFGDWREFKQTSGQIINPQQTALLDKIYSQTLSRSYVNSQGAIVMLSIAYGANQSQGLELHYPEVCYSAQGFQILAKEKDVLETEHGSILVKRLMTKLGARAEPVTYWTTLGDVIVRGGLQTKVGQIQYGLDDLIPDGLLFRVSSINGVARDGTELQNQFVKDLLSAVPQSTRLRLAGLTR